MKKKLLLIYTLFITTKIIGQNDMTNKIENELPQTVRYVDKDKDGNITREEAKVIFDQYRDNLDKHLENEVVEEVESTVIELISYLEKINCNDIKKSIASKRFIEVYYKNKFLIQNDANALNGIKTGLKDTLNSNAESTPIEEPSFFENYFSVGAQLISLYQKPYNFPKYKNDLSSDNPGQWEDATMVIIDVPIEFKPWKNATFNLTPEFTTGSAVGDAVGMGGYVNGIMGMSMPTPYIFRAQYAQSFEIKDTTRKIKGVQFIAGQVYTQDLFEYNSYSGDSYNDFLNYNHWMNSAWDAASNVFGYTYGAGIKIDTKSSQFNFAALTVNKEPAGSELDLNIRKAHSFNFQYVKRYNIGNMSGAFRALSFYNSVNSGKFTDHVIDSIGSPAYIPDSLKTYRAKYGIALDADLAITENFGLFTRYSWNDGQTESMHFTQADQSIALGLSLNLSKIKRPNDVIGIAGSMNTLSKAHKEYLTNGGTGFMINDGPINYKPEIAFEAYYKFQLIKYAAISANYQYIHNAGYNINKGNGHFAALRLAFIF